MGPGRWWQEQVLPRLVDLTLDDAGAGRYRTAVTAGLRGDVVELGFGSGRTLAHHPTEVELAGARYVTGWPLRAWGWFVHGTARPA